MFLPILASGAPSTGFLAGCVVQSMWPELTYRAMWCQLRGAIYVAGASELICVVRDIWCELCGVNYVA